MWLKPQGSGHHEIQNAGLVIAGDLPYMETLPRRYMRLAFLNRRSVISKIWGPGGTVDMCATVHKKRVPCHVATIFTGEKRDNGGNVLVRVANTPHWIVSVS